MRFLVDESAGKKLADLLAQEHDVIFVGDVFPSISDEKVLEIAKKQKRVLITDDKDFGELVFRLKKTNRRDYFAKDIAFKPKNAI